MTHGICKLILFKLKMSIFFFGIIYVIVGWEKKSVDSCDLSSQK